MIAHLTGWWVGCPWHVHLEWQRPADIGIAEFSIRDDSLESRDKHLGNYHRWSGNCVSNKTSLTQLMPLRDSNCTQGRIWSWKPHLQSNNAYIVYPLLCSLLVTSFSGQMLCRAWLQSVVKLRKVGAPWNTRRNEQRRGNQNIHIESTARETRVVGMLCTEQMGWNSLNATDCSGETRYLLCFPWGMHCRTARSKLFWFQLQGQMFQG